jgi:hypothetical protein
MALVPATLAAQIQSMIVNANPNAPAEATPQITAFCNDLATAIDAYIRTATVTVTTACGSGPGTGTGLLS